MTPKHLFFVAALGALTFAAPVAHAQAPQARKEARTKMAHKSPDEKAAAMTQRMTKQLTLTPEQQSKVSALNRQLAADLSELKAGHEAEKADKTARAARHAKVQSLRDAYAANLKSTLTPEQYGIFERQRAEMEQKQDAHQAARRAGRGKGPKSGARPTPEQPMLPPGPAQN